MNLRIEVLRYAASIKYRRDPSKPQAWDNNDANNSLDDFSLFDGENLILKCKIQTVCNMEGLGHGASFYDTVAPGRFDLRAFVEPRAFHGRIHGICNTMTLRGERIGLDSTSPTNLSRWLAHDRQKPKPAAPGQDTRVAWSAGCFVFADGDLELLGRIFDKHGITPGTLIPGVLNTSQG